MNLWFELDCAKHWCWVSTCSTRLWVWLQSSYGYGCNHTHNHSTFVFEYGFCNRRVWLIFHEEKTRKRKKKVQTSTNEQSTKGKYDLHRVWNDKKSFGRNLCLQDQVVPAVIVFWSSIGNQLWRKTVG